jgi:hydrogenase nickel incorporation protein HypA/HybF
MHELSICQALLAQVEEIANREDALSVDRIRVQVGPLAGVVAELLEHAFSIARAGTAAAEAELVIDALPVRIRCTQCGTETEATPNRLLCGKCGDFRTQLLSGDELLLASVELTRQEREDHPVPHARPDLMSAG